MKSIRFIVTATISLFTLCSFADEQSLEDIMSQGSKNYSQYCASCHGKNGEGNIGKSLQGSKIVTGDISENIKTVVFGKEHTQMPSWGKTELDDAALAEIITFTRNSWGNNDKKYGAQAGGIVTPKMIEQEREKIEQKPVSDNKRI